MTFNPCGCGNPMKDAKTYKRKNNVLLAKEMDRNFLVTTQHGMLQGVAGDYRVQDPQTGETWIMKRALFEATYEPVEETGTAS